MTLDQIRALLARDWPAAEVRGLCQQMGLSQEGLGDLLGVGRHSVRDWARDGVPNKGTARAALSLLAAQAGFPPPDETQKAPPG